MMVDGHDPLCLRAKGGPSTPIEQSNDTPAARAIAPRVAEALLARRWQLVFDEATELRNALSANDPNAAAIEVLDALCEVASDLDCETDDDDAFGHALEVAGDFARNKATLGKLSDTLTALYRAGWAAAVKVAS